MPVVTFESNPSGAAAIIGNQLIGTTPVKANIASGEIEVTFWKKGYEIQRYRTTVSTDGPVGVTLTEDESVPAPPSLSTPGGSKIPTVDPAPRRGRIGKVIVGVLVLGAAGAGGWWLWRRYRRSGSSFRGAGRPGAGATKIRGLGSAEVTCDASQAGNPYGVRTCITRPKKLGPVVDSPTAVCKLLRAAKDADRESFFTIAVGPRLNVLGVEETAKGQVEGVNVHPREVFKSAILLGASAVIVAHNHPSGDQTPSADDKELTKRLVKAGRLVGVPVMDHIVVGTGCDSLAERWPDLFKSNDEY